MTYFTVKNCCLFLNLRKGTFIIALICALVEFIAMIVNFAAICNIPGSENLSYVVFLRFFLFVFMLITLLKLSLCACLYVGLLERRPDHLETWYNGYAVLEIIHLGMIIMKAIYEADEKSEIFWIVHTVKLIVILTTFYFVLVVRSYHHQMCRQPNFYQDFSYQHNKMIGKMYCEKAKDEKGEIVLFAAPTEKKHFDIHPSFVHKESMVYSTPQSSELNLPIMPTVYLHNERRPSVADKRRHSSVSKPPKNFGYDNHVDLE